MVASGAPSCRIVACDLFIKNYGNMDNPGPDFVRSELARVGFAGSVEFIVGDSAIVVPDYFGRNPGQYFDLITVDGDHSERGARMDLVNVISRLKVGGAVVFDDVSNHSHPELVGVWRDVVGCSPNFSSCCFTDVGFGVAFAVRKS